MATRNQLMAKLEMMHGDILETLAYTTRNTHQIHSLGVQMTALTDKVAEVQAALDAFSGREAGEDAAQTAFAELSASTIAALQAQIDELNAGQEASIPALEAIKASLEALNPTPEPEPEPEPEPAPEEPTP